MAIDHLKVSNTGLLLFAAIGLYVIAIVIAIGEVPPAQGWDSTIKAMTVAVSVATGIFAPVSSIFLARYQARVASLSAQELESFKATISTELEVSKALIGGKVRAFDQMLTAAHFLYFVIRREVFRDADGSFETAKEADRRAAEASSVVWYLSEQDRALWFEVYQRSVYLLDEIQNTPRDVRRHIFEKHAPDLGMAIQELEKSGRAAFEEANRNRISESPLGD